MLLLVRQWAYLFALLIIGLGVAILVYDTNWLKPPIERIVSDRTGREFRIEGDLRIRPGLPTRVIVERVRFANPPWTAQKRMLELERADFRISLLRLLHGEIYIPRAHALKPVVDMEFGPKGQNNWTLGAKEDEPPDDGAVPEIGLLTIDRGTLTFHDPRKKTALKLDVSTTAHKGQQGVAFTLTGTRDALPVRAEGSGGALLSIKNRETPYPLDVRFRAGATHGSARGKITGLMTMSAVDLWLDVGGETMSELFPLIGVTLPPTPPWHIKGKLLHDGEYWRLHRFAGRVGDSDMSGNFDLRYDDRNDRANVVADITSTLLDIDDLGGFIGAPPQTGAGETASPAQKRQAAAAEARPRVLPDEPYKLDRLRAMDADIKFVGKAIRGRKLPLDDVKVHAILKDGVLTANPLNFGVAGGDVVSKITADARKDVLNVDSDIQFRRISLARLYPESELINKSTGLIGGHAILQAKGNSFARLLANSNGNFGLAMRGGRISNLLLEFTGLDAAEIVRFLLGGDRDVQIRCAVASFDVKEGLMLARSMVLDTTDTNLHMEGSVSLVNEAIKLTVHPLPKDWSPVALRSPIHVRGTFKEPDVSLDKKAFIKGGIATVLAALVAPLAALIPLIETGPGKDSDCGALIVAAERHGRTPPVPVQVPARAPPAPARTAR